VKKLVPVLVVGLVGALAAGAVALGAPTESYKVNASLVPKGEVPAPKAPAAAKGTFSGGYRENASGGVLTWKLSFTGLSGSAMAAHIHMGKPGKSGPVVVPLCGPCHTGMTGTAKLTKAVIKALESGGAYVNVHTAKNPGGEIRGQVKVTM
jgi:hypothetical protein